MISYNQRKFFEKSESGEKSLFPGANSSVLRLECTGTGSCKVFGKLFKQSDKVQLAGISASDYSVATEFQGGKVFSLEISGYHELVISSSGGLEISTKMVY